MGEGEIKDDGKEVKIEGGGGRRARRGEIKGEEEDREGGGRGRGGKRGIMDGGRALTKNEYEGRVRGKRK